MHDASTSGGVKWPLSLLVKLALVGVIVSAVEAAFPDIKRYLEIRHM